MDDCPKWINFLRESFSPEHSIRELQIFLGDSLRVSGVGKNAALDEPTTNAG